jgi:hypothetical protein
MAPSPHASEQQLQVDVEPFQSRATPQTTTLKPSGRSAAQSTDHSSKKDVNSAFTPPRTPHSRSPPKQNISSSPESKSSDSSTKPSVKHLSCWWWHEKGQCRYTESECLYAHHDTGMVADAPRQIKPGGTYYLCSHLPFNSQRTTHNQMFTFENTTAPFSYKNAHTYVLIGSLS